jgi:hypothetical protein
MTVCRNKNFLKESIEWENTMPTKKAGSGKKKVHKVMSEYKHGSLKSGSGGKVKSRKQAVAIALSEARSSGAKIPKKKAKS